MTQETTPERAPCSTTPASARGHTTVQRSRVGLLVARNTRPASSARSPTTLIQRAQPKLAMTNSFIVRIFVSCVQDRCTGFGSDDEASNRAARGSPLRLALLWLTSAHPSAARARNSNHRIGTFRAAPQSRTKSSVAGISRPVFAKHTTTSGGSVPPCARACGRSFSRR